VARTVESHATDVTGGASPAGPTPSPSPGTGAPGADAASTEGGDPAHPTAAPDSVAPISAIPVGGPRTLRDPLAEALRVIDLAAQRGLEVRLMGGLAFHAECRTWTARIDRDGRDIDLATRTKDRKALQALLVEEGYVPDRQYNALYGHKQLYFVDPVWNRPVDVLIDRLDMCHAFSFGDRLGISGPTLPPADLLLTKLQVVKLNRKDLLDALALLSEYPLAADDDGGRAISLRRITELTSNDWGWWRTLTGNLDKLTESLATDVRPGDLDFGRAGHYEPAAQIERLRAAIDEAPKSTRWKLRARVGDRMPWYELPEEVGHGR
jgi:hypothetical protein